jgi:hypothetical protein
MSASAALLARRVTNTLKNNLFHQLNMPPALKETGVILAVEAI